MLALLKQYITPKTVLVIAQLFHLGLGAVLGTIAILAAAA